MSLAENMRDNYVCLLRTVRAKVVDSNVRILPVRCGIARSGSCLVWASSHDESRTPKARYALRSRKAKSVAWTRFHEFCAITVFNSRRQWWRHGHYNLFGADRIVSSDVVVA
jgi:hypothetical protein